MTRRNFFEAILFLLTFIFAEENSDAEENKEQLHEAMFWRRVDND